jgi:hypothetical protein
MHQQMSSSELYERGFVLMELRMFHPAIDDFQTAARDARYAGKAYVPMALCLREPLAGMKKRLRHFDELSRRLWSHPSNNATSSTTWGVRWNP